MAQLNIALAQTNPRVGDYEGNLARIWESITVAGKSGADLVLFGELALTGYPPGDLAYRSDVLSHAELALNELIAKSVAYPDLTVVVGHISHAKNADHWAKAHNSATVFRAGNVVGRYHKQQLPNYAIFDDYRIFVPGTEELIFEVSGVRCAIMICEDIWRPGTRLKELASQGVELVLSPNGSPFESGKHAERLRISEKFAENNLALAYTNLVGGQDDLVFDGGSFLIDRNGIVQCQAEFFQEGVYFTANREVISQPSEISALRQAISLGIRDYVIKTGNQKIAVGLSGGIDSAVVAALAVDALGNQNVIGVRMPSRYSSEHSLDDAEQLANNLGIELRTHPIDLAHRAFEDTLALSSLAAENIQARIRAVIMMAISNNESALVLNTGNKSEVAVGYSTIYGDSIGAYAPLKDLYKTDVWRLARWINQSAEKELIPSSSIEKAPSAELRPGQLDTDSLPDYQVLDRILRLLIEEHATVAEVTSQGFEVELVNRVDKMVRAAEWKRSQGPIGPRLSKVSFGRGRRVPLATKFGDLT